MKTQSSEQWSNYKLKSTHDAKITHILTRILPRKIPLQWDRLTDKPTSLYARCPENWWSFACDDYHRGSHVRLALLFATILFWIYFGENYECGISFNINHEKAHTGLDFHLRSLKRQLNDLNLFFPVLSFDMLRRVCCVGWEFSRLTMKWLIGSFTSDGFKFELSLSRYQISTSTPLNSSLMFLTRWFNSLLAVFFPTSIAKQNARGSAAWKSMR